MKVLIYSCVILTLTLAVDAWIGLESHQGEFSGECTPTMFKVGPLKVNETKRIPDKCATATCKENGDVKYSGCAPMQARPPCYVTDGLLSNPFPKCCYEIICPEDQTNTVNLDD